MMCPTCAVDSDAVQTTNRGGHPTQVTLACHHTWLINPNRGLGTKFKMAEYKDMYGQVQQKRIAVEIDERMLIPLDDAGTQASFAAQRDQNVDVPIISDKAAGA